MWNVKNKKKDEVLKLSMRDKILYEKKVQEMENIQRMKSFASNTTEIWFKSNFTTRK